MTSRKTTNSIPLVIAIALIATMVVAAGMHYYYKVCICTRAEKECTAKLSGKNEVPPKITKATGTAEFTLSSYGKTMTYKVDVKDIDKVTMAHIHQGKTGENGPVVVTLFKVQTYWS